MVEQDQMYLQHLDQVYLIQDFMQEEVEVVQMIVDQQEQVDQVVEEMVEFNQVIQDQVEQ
jgi:2-phosphoglycerate kinase